MQSDTVKIGDPVEKKSRANLVLDLSALAGTWLVGFGMFIHEAMTGRATPLEPSIEETILSMVALGVLGMMLHFSLTVRRGRFLSRAALIVFWTVPLFKITQGARYLPEDVREAAPVVAAGIFILILLARREDTLYYNSFEEACAFVKDYHASRTEPFTRKEEGKLINTLMRRFGLGEESAAEAVKEEWPRHRVWRPEIE